eukprot:11536035-Alexandrium_andersonii.AAC.1
MTKKGSPRPWTSTANRWASPERRWPITTGMPGSLTRTPTPPRGPLARRCAPPRVWASAGRNWLDQV